MNRKLDVLLLLALPGSGKTELQRYLARQSPDYCLNNYNLGPLILLDDFPYVHLMRKLDVALARLGEQGCYFQSGARSFMSLDWNTLAKVRYACGSGWHFKDPVSWCVLTAMLDEDYRDLLAGRKTEPVSAARHIFERLDATSKKLGGQEGFSMISGKVQEQVCALLEDDARHVVNRKNVYASGSLDDKTVVFEFSRGCYAGSGMPLSKPYGYYHSLQLLSGAVLEKASVLYIWVTPEQSAKNSQRMVFQTHDSSSSQLHLPGVPVEVLASSFGCDDMDWLEKTSERPDTVTIGKDGHKYYLPVARYDNRDTGLKFLHGSPDTWGEAELLNVHNNLKFAMNRLANLRSS